MCSRGGIQYSRVSTQQDAVQLRGFVRSAAGINQAIELAPGFMGATPAENAMKRR